MDKIWEQLSCNISKNQLEISNIGEVIDNGIQKRELADLEGVVETTLEQSYEKIILWQNSKISIEITRRLI